MNEEQLNRKVKPGSVESSYVMDSLFPEDPLDVSAYDIPEETAGQNILKANKIQDTASKQSNIAFPELELKKEYNQSKKKDYAYLAQKTDNAGNINGQYGRTPLEIARLKNEIAPKDSSGRVINKIPDNVSKLSDRILKDRLLKEQESEAIGNERLQKFYSNLEAERKTEQIVRERAKIDAQLNTPEDKTARAYDENRLKALYEKTGFKVPKKPEKQPLNIEFNTTYTDTTLDFAGLKEKGPKGPIEYSADELLADNVAQLKGNKVYGLGKRRVNGMPGKIAPYRTIKPEVPSKAMKYGSYALGALAATALVNTMFFGDKKGEQTNAQLYGQQPLY